MAKCNAKFTKDPSYRDLKCELPKGHAAWHEYGTTMWADENAPEPTISPKKRSES
jgi:hypothetical protein